MFSLWPNILNFLLLFVIWFILIIGLFSLYDKIIKHEASQDASINILYDVFNSQNRCKSDVCQTKK